MKTLFKKPKQPKAPWTRIKTPGFQQQQEGLRPEVGKAGGIRVRSVPEAIRTGIYRPIAELFKKEHPLCECCHPIFNRESRGTQDVHHTHGRDGLLLFDIRKFKSACRECHDWIQAHPIEAQQLGLLSKKGAWREL